MTVQLESIKNVKISHQNIALYGIRKNTAMAVFLKINNVVTKPVSWKLPSIETEAIPTVVVIPTKVTPPLDHKSTK